MKPILIPLVSGIVLGAAGHWGLLRVVALSPSSAAAAVSLRVSQEDPSTEAAKNANDRKTKPDEKEKGASGIASLADLRKSFKDKSPFAANAAIQQTILGFSAEQVREIAKEACMTDDWWDDKSTTIRNLLLQRWTELDTEGALDYATTRSSWQAYRIVDGIFRTGIVQNKEATIASLAKMPGGFGKARASATVLETLAERDPREALSLWDNKTVRGNPNLISGIFSAWAKNDPDAAAGEWTKRANGPGAQMALYGLMTSWAQMEPEAAFQWSLKIAKPADRSVALNSYFAQVTQKDPQEALKKVETLGGTERANSLRAISQAWAESDPSEAEKWVKSRTNPMERAQRLNELASSLRWADPKRSFEIGLELPKGPERIGILLGAVGMLGYGDVSESEELVQRLSGHEQTKAREGIIGQLVWQDPAKAIKMLTDHQPKDPADEIYQSMGRRLVSKDPEMALKWAAGLADPASQRQAYPALFSAWAGSDPQKASAAAQDLKDPNMRKESIANIGTTWASVDHEKALAWAETLTGEDQSAALGAVFNAAVGHKPKEIAPQIMQALRRLPADRGVPDSFLQASKGAAKAMVAENPVQAAQWAQSVPQESCRHEVIADVAAQWVDQDWHAASKWIDTIPPGLGRDKSVSNLITQIAASEPSSAFEWALTVQDSGIRSQTLEATFGAWKKVDGSAAEEAIKGSGLSEAEKQRWLQLVH